LTFDLAVEFMVPQYPKYLLVMLDLSLEETEKVVVVYETPDIAGENEVGGCWWDLECGILLSDFKVEVAEDLEAGGWLV
jgi:hypothetical protein